MYNRQETKKRRKKKRDQTTTTMCSLIVDCLYIRAHIKTILRYRAVPCICSMQNTGYGSIINTYSYIALKSVFRMCAAAAEKHQIAVKGPVSSLSEWAQAHGDAFDKRFIIDISEVDRGLGKRSYKCTITDTKTNKSIESGGRSRKDAKAATCKLMLEILKADLDTPNNKLPSYTDVSISAPVNIPDTIIVANKTQPTKPIPKPGTIAKKKTLDSKSAKDHAIYTEMLRYIGGIYEDRVISNLSIISLEERFEIIETTNKNNACTVFICKMIDKQSVYNEVTEKGPNRKIARSFACEEIYKQIEQ